MRILLLADIHANWPALQALHALQEPHDLCFVLGDLVDYGLDPVPCIEWVQEHAHYTIRGNHDHAVAQRAVTNGAAGFRYLSGLTRGLTWEKLSPAYLRYLGSLPVSYLLTVDGTRFLLIHATPRDPLEEYAPADPEFWAKRLERVQADVVCVGHTHQPYVLPVGDKLVINPGSVGQPRDGDPRACYAIWDGGQVELKRVSYPIEETVQSIEASRLPEPAKRLSIEVYRTGLPPSALVNHVGAATPRSAVEAGDGHSGKPQEAAPGPAPETPAGNGEEQPSSVEVVFQLEAGECPAPAERAAESSGAGPQAETDHIDLEGRRETDSGLSEHLFSQSTAAAAESSPVADTHPQFTHEAPARTEPPGELEPAAKSEAQPEREVDMAETLPGPFDFRFDWTDLGLEPPSKKGDQKKEPPPK